MKHITISIIFTIAITQSVFAQASFSAKTDFTTGTAPYSVSIGDFNCDGINDIAVANYASNTVSVFLNTTIPGAATPTFSDKTDFTTGNGPFSVSIGDFNGDGKNDMAVANYGSSTVSVFLNTTTPGAATPTFSVKTDFNTGNNPFWVSIGDFNGDNKIDIAVANFSANTVSVLINTTAPGAATPSFSAKTDFITGVTPYSVSIGDFNGDGRNDMAVANNSSNTVSVLLNTAVPGTTTPSFSSKTDFTTGSMPQSVSIGDFNGDGRNDMAVANEGSNTVSVMLNTTAPGATTPSFSAKVDFEAGNASTSVSIGDFNGDGRNDLAVANYYSNTVSVFVNTTSPGAATPSFSARVDSATGNNPISLSIGDINGDGKNDMVVANYNSNTVSALLNTTIMGVATPSFSAKEDSTTGNHPESVSIGDINGDGKKDMAVANYSSASVSVFLNTTIPGAVTLSFSAKTDFTTGTNPASVSIGDFNGDGKNDMAAANYGSNTVSIFFNTTTPGAATPTFSDKTDFTTGNSPFSVSIGDFNGDGKNDIAVANFSSNTVSVLLNTTAPGATTPSFSAKTDFTTGTTPYSVSIGDFNGDGMNDMAVVNESSYTVSVLLNTTAPGATTPSFSAKTDFATGSTPTSVSIRDFNGDGKNDMAIANYGSSTVSVLLNTMAPGAATPSFSAKADFATGATPYSVSIGDFNGDDKNDMAVTHYAFDFVSVFLNTTAPGATTPSFSAKTDFITGSTPISISIADFNGDGKNDIAVANYSSNTVSVLLNNADFPTSVELTSSTARVPETFALAQNYPNPFNPSTMINYAVPNVGTRHVVSLRVYDMLGREVTTLVNEEKPAGSYQVQWNASGLSSGIYILKMTVDQFSSVRKMLMIK
jgi:hypothetical protein